MNEQPFFSCNKWKSYILEPSGVYINFEIQIPPPPFLTNIFGPSEIYYTEGVRAAGKNV